MTGAYWKGHERRNSVPLGVNKMRRRSDRVEQAAPVYPFPVSPPMTEEQARTFEFDSSPSSDSGSSDSGSSYDGGGGSFDGGGASGDY